MKKETIVVASSNKGKISEIKEIFKDYDGITKINIVHWLLKGE